MAHHQHDQPIVTPMEEPLPVGETMKRQSLTSTAPVIQATPHACETAGHVWHPTIILGYFQCRQCSKLAACTACVSNLRGKALPGYCQAHRHLRTPERELEVLG